MLFRSVRSPAGAGAADRMLVMAAAGLEIECRWPGSGWSLWLARCVANLSVEDGGRRRGRSPWRDSSGPGLRLERSGSGCRCSRGQNKLRSAAAILSQWMSESARGRTAPATDIIPRIAGQWRLTRISVAAAAGGRGPSYGSPLK